MDKLSVLQWVDERITSLQKNINNYDDTKIVLETIENLKYIQQNLK